MHFTIVKYLLRGLSPRADYTSYIIFLLSLVSQWNW